MRERRRVECHAVAAIGITPACAGKTFVAHRKIVKGEDHPRMCGKDRFKHYQRKSNEGSPPHVRERPKTREIKLKGVGITPACAGKTTFRFSEWYAA